MGDFRIVIDAVGGHGQDREKKDEETVDFNQGGDNSPEAIALKFIEEMKSKGISIQKATIIHWPIDNYGGPEKNGRTKRIEDDLISGVRSGSF